MSTIQALSNLEYQLYGNTSAYCNTAVPSMINNYCAPMSYMYQNPYMNTYMNPYMYSPYYNPATNPSFTQNIPSMTTTQNTTATSNNAFAGLSKQELNALINDYVSGMSPSESLLGAGASGVLFAGITKPRLFIHPINSIKSLKTTSEMFADVRKTGTKLAEAWADQGCNEVLRDAYSAMNAIDARNLKKKGLHIWRKPFENGEYKDLYDIMNNALKGLDKNNKDSINKVIDVTEQLKQANVKNGGLPRAWNWVKNIFRSEKIELPTVGNSIKVNQNAINESVANALSAGKGTAKTYLETLKTSGGGKKGAIVFLGIDFLMNAGKIINSFKKDSKTGWTQLGQTTVKGVGSAIGWAAGEALGTWGCAKLLAKLGTRIAPGVGTAIGAVAGMVVGSIGCALSGKITKRLVGNNVGDKVQAETLAQTTEGQKQLLENTIQRMQKGEKVDIQAQMAVQKLLTA